MGKQECGDMPRGKYPSPALNAVTRSARPKETAPKRRVYSAPKAKQPSKRSVASSSNRGWSGQSAEHMDKGYTVRNTATTRSDFEQPRGGQLAAPAREDTKHRLGVQPPPVYEVHDATATMTPGDFRRSPPQYSSCISLTTTQPPPGWEVAEQL